MRCRKEEIEALIEETIRVANSEYMKGDTSMHDAVELIRRVQANICQCEECVTDRVYEGLGVEGPKWHA